MNPKLVDEYRTPIGKLEVQIKKLPDDALKMPCPISLYAYSEKTPLPFLFIGVDIKQKKAYWLHIAVENLNQPLESFTQKTLTLNFPLNNVVDGKDTRYLIEWKNIAESYLKRVKEYEKYRSLIEGSNPAVGLTKEEFADIQTFLDEYNSKLDGEFAVVKNIYYNASWKIGLAYYSYEENKVEYTLYPIPYGKNDVLIKEVDAKLRQQLNREGLGIKGYCKENPIHIRPRKQAIVELEERTSRILEKRQLNNQCSEFLAREFVFAFIDKFSEQMGLDNKNEYSIDEIDRAFFQYLPNWTLEAIKFMIRVRRNNVTSVARVFYGRPYIDPDILLVQIMDEERKEIQSQVQQNIKNNSPIPMMPMGNDKLPFRLFFQFLAYLKWNKISQINRPYLPRDYSRLEKGHGWVWSLFSPETLEENLKVFFSNLPKVYELVLETNFPKIRNNLSMFNNASLEVVLFDVKEEIKHFTDAPEIEFYGLKSPDKKKLEIQLRKKNQAKEFSSLSFKTVDFSKEIDIEGTRYTWANASSSVLDFIFEDLPMLNFVYKMLEDNLKKYFRNLQNAC